MLLFVLAYLGGVLTILSPCILPVLPFVFARSDRPFLRSGLPMLAGMAATFALVATLAAVGGGWAVAANGWARGVALVLLALFGLALLLPQLADRMMQPLVALGGRLAQRADAQDADGQGRGGVLPSLLLGVATGLLWAPCAGPILGLILTGAALKGASAATSALLLAYAAGAATSLALALVIGGRVFAAMKSGLGAGEWVRRGLGAAVLVGVAAIALGADTGLLSRLSQPATTVLEQGLVDRFRAADGQAARPETSKAAIAAGILPVEGAMPPLDGVTQWLNSPPLTREQLKGKVVLVDFWTYSCINCIRSIPYIRAWAEKYKDDGLVVIGVHAPEFAFEKDVGNVKTAIAGLGIKYPVAIDNDFAIWRAYDNHYWPAHYFIDREGRIRHHHFGEGQYDESERVLQMLLREGGGKAPSGLVAVDGTGTEAASKDADVNSPETYVGSARAENFVSPEDVGDNETTHYTVGAPPLNHWGFDGDWTVKPEHSRLDKPDGAIVYRFHARDLHLVLGPGADGRPIRFKVTIDGKAPGDSHGMDTDADGAGTVNGQRLYQLVRQKGMVVDHTFRIEFLDPGVQAYAFTFG